MNEAALVTADTAPAITLDVNDGIAMVRMTRARQRNPFTTEFRSRMTEIMSEVQARDDIDVLMLTGSDGVFSAGGDVKGMAARTSGKAPPPDADRRRLYTLHTWLQSLRTLEIPVIAAVDGPAYGGGFALALCADFVLATPRARFCCVFGRIGLVPDCSVFFTLPRMVGLQRAKELMFTGRALDAHEAKDLGIVLDVHAPEQLLIEAQKLANRLQRASSTALGITKRIVNQAFDLDANALVEMEAAAQAICLASDYHKQAALRFSEKQPLLFNWEQFEKDDGG
ncbi:MAG: enoyl-CoA hydratase/isomerase family protein [Hyphomicrobiaceae bacterium]